MKEVLVDDEYMKLSFEWHEEQPFLHLEVRKWSHTLLKNYFFPQWVETQKYFKEKGAKAMFAIIPSHETKIAKFHSIMGMHEAYKDESIIISRRWL